MNKWMAIVVHATPISFFVLALFYHWFAVADRYATFLYGHLGATPFDEITSGRYWMAGLVADGAVMVIYAVANLFIGRIISGYQAPDWRRVWLACALPLGVGIAIITMTQNSPTLPVHLAMASLAATLTGLAFALMPGALAARRAREFVWLAVSGFGLMPTLVMFRAMELPGKGLFPSPAALYLAAIGSVLFGLAWLAALGLVRSRLNASMPNVLATFISGVCWSYLLLPLAHYIFATPAAYKYITAASNFFASNIGIQLLALAIAAALPIAASRFTNNASRLAHGVSLLP
jgi:hypothetical protein